MSWNGILIIRNFKHWRKGKVIKQYDKLHNLLHNEGEEFILTAAFINQNVIPDNYFFGLDNRSFLSVTQTLSDITDEPSAGGYVRQSVASSGDFVIDFNVNFIALSPVVAFQASPGEGWGPIQNLFLTNVSDLDPDGFLISSIQIPSPIFVSDGDQVTFRMQLAMKDCPPA